MGRRRYQHPNVLKTKTKRPQWYYRVQIDVLVDRNRTGRREKAVYLGFCDEMGKRQAEKLRDVKLKEVNNTPALIQSQVRLADVIAVYRSTYLPGLKPSSAHEFDSRLGKHIDRQLGQLRLFEVDPIRVQQWIYQLEDEGVSQNRRAAALTTLRSVWEAAATWGYTQARNPCKGIKLGNEKPDEHRDLRALDPWEVKKLLIAIPEEPLRLITETALYTDLRISEVLGLTWGAIDFRRRVLQVRQGRSQQGVIAAPKSRAGRRPVPIGFLADRFERPDGAKDSDLIWPDVTYSELQKRLRARAKTAGIDFSGFGFHTFRRTHATLRMLLGYMEPPAELVKQMGHSSAAMTSRYIRLEIDWVERMRKLIDSSGDPREREAQSNVVSILSGT